MKQTILGAICLSLAASIWAVCMLLANMYSTLSHHSHSFGYALSLLLLFCI